MSIVKVVTQLRKDGTEMFLYGQDNKVERVIFDSIDLTNGASGLEEGNVPSDVSVKFSETIDANEIVQCVECQKFITKATSKGEPDEEVCLNGCYH